MPGINGMQAAHEIRAFDAGVKIVFLTSSPEFAVESYAVKAYDYILKPVSKDKLFSILDAVIAEELKPLEGLTVKTQSGITRILFSRLAFVEIMNKKLYFHLADGSVRGFRLHWHRLRKICSPALSLSRCIALILSTFGRWASSGQKSSSPMPEKPCRFPACFMGRYARPI